MSQPDYGQYVDMDFFVWQRANAGYLIESKPEGEVYRVFGKDIARETLRMEAVEDSGPFISEKKESTGYITSKPLDEVSTLFVDFADLDGSTESFIEFANQRGLLTQSYRQDSPMPRQGEVIHDTAGNIKQIKMDSLELWETEHWILKMVTEVWEWLQNKEISNLQRIVKWNKSGFQVEMGSQNSALFASTSVSSANRQLFTRFVQGDVFLPAQYFIQTQINKKLRQYPVHSTLLMSTDNKLKQYFVPENLLAAMWFQFFQAATGEKRFKRCKVCQKWVDVTDKKETWEKHPTCANRARVRKHRNKGGL